MVNEGISKECCVHLARILFAVMGLYTLMFDQLVHVLPLKLSIIHYELSV